MLPAPSNIEFGLQRDVRRHISEVFEGTASMYFVGHGRVFVVVFSRRPVSESGNSGLWIIPASGGEARPLTPADFPLQCTRPAWSPDGKLIAFRAARSDENAGGIWIIGADGRGLWRLTDEEKADDVYAAWTPSGNSIVFSRGLITQEPSNDLWEVRLDGWQRQLTRGDKYDGKATVSPDGTSIAFSTDRPDQHYPDTKIWTMSIAEGDLSARPFTNDHGVAPAWSPDGRSIVFQKADSHTHHHLEVLYVVGLLEAAK